VEFLERQGASAAVGGEIGRERGDAFEKSLGAGVEIEWCRVALNGENEEVAPGAGVAGLSATVHCT